MAWADWDNDGTLDLASANWGQANRVHENSGGGMPAGGVNLSAVTVASAAWGDWNGDEDLDIAIGFSSSQANKPGVGQQRRLFHLGLAARTTASTRGASRGGTGTAMATSTSPLGTQVFC